MALNRVPSPSPDDTNTSTAKHIECTCDTHVKLGTISYTWRINNFKFCQKDISKCVKSPKFPDDPSGNGQWRLNMYLNGVDENRKDFVAVYLYYIPRDFSEATARVRFSIVNAEMKRVHTTLGSVCTFARPNILSTGFPKFIRREVLLSRLKDFTADGALTIFCEISITEDIVHTSEQFNVAASLETDLVNDIGLLFENHECADLTIIVGEKQFPVHRAILAARSTVFLSMFKIKLESGKNCVEMIDMNHEVVREMLRFVYTGRVANIEKMADGLLAAADKYALSGLKSMCETALRAAIAIDNAASTLILADRHGADLLKADVLDFICKHVKAVKNTEGFESMIVTHPHLLAEAFSALAMKSEADSGESNISKRAKKS